MRKPILHTVSINDTVEIFGYKFHSLTEIRDAVGYSSTSSSWKGDKPYIITDAPKTRIPGLHVLEIYQRYPCFDSSDYAYEDRFYRNYFFLEKPFTKADIIRLAEMKRVGNLEYIADEMPEQALPSVYYVGEGNDMIVAL